MLYPNSSSPQLWSEIRRLPTPIDIRNVTYTHHVYDLMADSHESAVIAKSLFECSPETIKKDVQLAVKEGVFFCINSEKKIGSWSVNQNLRHILRTSPADIGLAGRKILPLDGIVIIIHTGAINAYANILQTLVHELRHHYYFLFNVTPFDYVLKKHHLDIRIFDTLLPALADPFFHRARNIHEHGKINRSLLTCYFDDMRAYYKSNPNTNYFDYKPYHDEAIFTAPYLYFENKLVNSLQEHFAREEMEALSIKIREICKSEFNKYLLEATYHPLPHLAKELRLLFPGFSNKYIRTNIALAMMYARSEIGPFFAQVEIKTPGLTFQMAPQTANLLKNLDNSKIKIGPQLNNFAAYMAANAKVKPFEKVNSLPFEKRVIEHQFAHNAGQSSNIGNNHNMTSNIPVPKKIDNCHSQGPHLEDATHSMLSKKSKISFIKGLPGDASFRGLKFAASDSTFCYGSSKTADGFFIYIGKQSPNVSHLPQMKVIKVPDLLSKAVQGIYANYPKIERGISNGIRLFNIVFYGVSIAIEAYKTYQNYDVTVLEAISHASRKIAISEAMLAVSGLVVGGPTAFILFAIAELAEMSPDLRERWADESRKIEEFTKSSKYNNLPPNVRHIWLREQIKLQPYADPSILISAHLQHFFKKFSVEGIANRYNAFVLADKKKPDDQPLTAWQKANILPQIEDLLNKEGGKTESYSLLGLDQLRAWVNEKIWIPSPGSYLGLPDKTSGQKEALLITPPANGLLEHIAQNPPIKKESPLAWLSSKNNRRLPSDVARKVALDRERRFSMPNNDSPMEKVPLVIPIPIKNPNSTTPQIDINIQIDIQGVVDGIINVCKKETIDSNDVELHGDIYHYNVRYEKSDGILIEVKDPSGHSQEAMVKLKKIMWFIPSSPGHKDNQKSIRETLEKLLQKSVSNYIENQVNTLQNQCMEALKNPETCLQSIIDLTDNIQKKYPGEGFISLNHLWNEYVIQAIKSQVKTTPMNFSQPLSLERINNKLPDLKPLSTYDEMFYRLHLPVAARRGKKSILGEGEPASHGDVNFINLQFKNLFHGKNILQIDRVAVASFIAHLETVSNNWNRVTQYSDNKNKLAEHDENIKALSTYMDDVKDLYRILCNTQDTFQKADLTGFMGQLASLSKAPNAFVEEALIQGMQLRINETLKSNDVDSIMDLKSLVENKKIAELIPILAQYVIHTPLTFAQFIGLLFAKKLSETMLTHFKRGQFTIAKDIWQSIGEKNNNEDLEPILVLYHQYLNQTLDKSSLSKLSLLDLSQAFFTKHEGSAKEMPSSIKNFFLSELLKYYAQALDKICDDRIPEQFRRVAAKDVVSIANLIDKDKVELSTCGAVEENAPINVLIEQSPKIVALFKQCNGDYAWITLWMRWEKANAILKNTALSHEERERAFRNLEQIHLDSINMEQNSTSTSNELKEFILATKNYHIQFTNVHGDLKLFFECQELYQLFNLLEDKNLPANDQQAAFQQIQQKTQSIVPQLKDIPTKTLVNGKPTEVLISNPLTNALQRELDRCKMAAGKISIYRQIVELDNMVMATLGEKEGEKEKLSKMYEMAKKVKENCPTPEGKAYCDEIIAIKYRYHVCPLIQPVANSFLYAFGNLSTRWGAHFMQSVNLLLQCIQNQFPSVLPDLFIFPYASFCQDNWQYMFKKNVANQLAQYQKCLSSPFENLGNFLGSIGVSAGFLNMAGIICTGKEPKLSSYVTTPLKIAQLGYYYLADTNEEAKRLQVNNLKVFAVDSFTDLAVSIYEFIYSDPEADKPSIIFSLFDLMMQKLGKKINRQPGYLSQLPATAHLFPDIMKLVVYIFSQNKPLLTLQAFKLTFNAATGHYIEGYIQYALKDAKYFLKIGDYIKCEERVKTMKQSIAYLAKHLPAKFGYNAETECYSNYDSHIIKAAKSFFITFYAAKFTNEGQLSLVVNITHFNQDNGQFILSESKVPLAESVMAIIYRLKALLKMNPSRGSIRSEYVFLEKFYRELYKNQMKEPAVVGILEQFLDIKNLLDHQKKVAFEMPILLKYRNDLSQGRKPKKYSLIKDEAHENPELVSVAMPAPEGISPDF